MDSIQEVAKCTKALLTRIHKVDRHGRERGAGGTSGGWELLADNDRTNAHSHNPTPLQDPLRIFLGVIFKATFSSKTGG